MSGPVEAPRPAAGTEELRAALARALRDHCGAARSIVVLARRPSTYRTSFALEELDVGLDDGATLRLIFKDLSWGALHEAARAAKPAFLHDPRREIAVYRAILAPARLGTARCYGAVSDERAGRYWLFLERVPGVELYQIGAFDIWQRAARWLALLHARFAGTRGLPAGACLVDYDAEFYRTWMRRARLFAGGGASRDDRDAREAVAWLAGRYERVVARLAALPRTVIHGEFFASNVLVHERPDGPRIAPVDWEMAALGPGLVDLAALVAGGWTEEEKRALALAYHAALPPALRRAGPDDLLAELDYCRLHLAVQWLGWAPDWSPPAEHAQDWLGEALALAAKLGL